MELDFGPRTANPKPRPFHYGALMLLYTGNNHFEYLNFVSVKKKCFSIPLYISFPIHLNVVDIMLISQTNFISKNGR